MNPVLCISRTELDKQFKTEEGCNAYKFDVNKIDEDHLHFLSRKVCDKKDETNYPEHDLIGELLPQVLPYVQVICDDEVLTYSRAKGAETRLHGSLSCGFGGHVDIGDIDVNDFNLGYAVTRELREELNLASPDPDGNVEFTLKYQGAAIVDTTNAVGCVHVGLFYVLDLKHKQVIHPDPSEITLAEWKTQDQLEVEIDRYENWSQCLIKTFKV